MTLNPTYEQLARLRTLLDKANAGRRVRIFELDTVLEVAREALSSKLGFAWRHAGAHVDARASTTLCVAVHSSKGVTVGLAGTSAHDPDPGKGWAELRPWNARVPAQNVPKAEAWGERGRADRLTLDVDAVRPRRPASDGEALLQAVLAAPDDDAPRLVYADWLNEQSDPRGELIAVQCARARGETDRALEEREWTLLSLHGEAWRKALGEGVLAVKHRRGFPDEVSLTAGAFVEGAESMFAAAPIRTIHFVNTGAEGAAQVAASHALKRVAAIRFTTEANGPRLQAEGLAALLESRNLGLLEGLSFEAQALEDLGAMILKQRGPGALPSLRSLAVLNDGVTGIGAAQLTYAPWFRRLKRLSFAGNLLGDEGMDAFAFLAPGAGAWEELDFDKNAIHDAGARALATHDKLGALRRLSLRGNQIGTAGAQALLDSQRLASLEALRLDDNRIGKLLSEKVRARFGRW